MSASPTPGPKAFVFDAYGTLLDLFSATEGAMAELGDKGAVVADLWRSKQLEYSWLRSLMGQHTDFWQVTSDALHFALRSHDLDEPKRHARLMEHYLTLEAYSDAAPMLQSLKARGYPTMILSNGARAMLDEAVRHAGLSSHLDDTLSIDEVGVYKPSPQVYQLAADRIGCTPGEIVFVSSNAWDVAGASSFGFRVAWINRFQKTPEELPGKPEFVIDTLAELPSLFTE